MMFLFLHPDAAETSTAAHTRQATEKPYEINAAFRTDAMCFCSRSADLDFAGGGAVSGLSDES